ncbi:MAG: FAD-dependent oxidoreductase [Aestuariivirga sp.]
MEGLNRLNSHRIVVIGSGIAGLSAAWLLSQRHDVTLIEAEHRIGGHSNTVNCTTPDGPVAVDTGFIVYNTATYPNLMALFDYLNVPTTPSLMGFGVSLDGGACEYSGDTLLQMMGNPGNLVVPGHWRMLWDIVRFFRTAQAQCQDLDEGVTLGQFLKSNGYSQAFMDRHLLPMAGAIWSSSPNQMMDYPALSFLKFLGNHGLLQYNNRPQWRTVTGGSREYVERLVGDSRFRLLTGCPVHAVERSASGVVIRAGNGFMERFDHVVIGTHADQALAMLKDPSPEEHQCLSAFRYGRNRAVLHRDPALMPRRRRLWSSWNYMADRHAHGRSSSITYWMNALQPLATSTDIFVSLNPQREPEAGLVEREFAYEHPIFTAEAGLMQKRLWSLQGQQRTWFSGAHFGAGFHEDALQSGLAVAEHLGGMLRPWNVANPSSRIHVTPHTPAPESSHLEAAE